MEQAQQHLPAGLHLRVYEGYRHPKIQQMLFDAQWRRMQIAHPDQGAAWCHAQAAMLASPLRTFAGEPMIPPHVGLKRMVDLVREAELKEKDAEKRAALAALGETLRKVKP